MATRKFNGFTPEAIRTIATEICEGIHAREKAEADEEVAEMVDEDGIPLRVYVEENRAKGIVPPWEEVVDPLLLYPKPKLLN